MLCDGADGTGDLTVWDNVEQLAETVRHATDGSVLDEQGGLSVIHPGQPVQERASRVMGQYSSIRALTDLGGGLDVS